MYMYILFAQSVGQTPRPQIFAKVLADIGLERVVVWFGLVSFIQLDAFGRHRRAAQ